MKLKTIDIEGKTYAEIQDGKPLYLGDDGNEIAFDAPHTAATIARLNGEAKTHREAKEAAEASLKAFKGITDPAAAKKALQTVAGLDAKALIDAGKADEMRAAAIKAVEEQYKPFKERAEALETELRSEKIGGSFARSKFIAEKLAVPVQMVEATFGRHFELKDGRIVATDANGNQIYSKARPGEPADFDEALDALVGSSPFRDSIMKGLNQSGTGAKPGAGGGGKTLTRSQFDALSPHERTAKMGEGYAITD